MNGDLLEQLCCPNCRGKLELESISPRHSFDRVDRGALKCLGCVRSYPITNGIPRFVGSEAYTSTFGRQWTRYSVERLDEDEKTFECKTGFRLGELAGCQIVDAGCGGGRYSFVAAQHGGRVIAVDMSKAVDRAQRLCASLRNVDFVQADLLQLPIRAAAADRAFSIGVLHHSSHPQRAFNCVAETVRPGGKLAVWLYRRNTFAQEALNEILRGIARRLSVSQLESLAGLGAVLGSIPLINQSLNKLVNFSNHPNWENRVCDTFDWYSPVYQSHHTVEQLKAWFENAGFEHLQELPPEKSGLVYRWAYELDLLIGSGVNVVATRKCGDM